MTFEETGLSKSLLEAIHEMGFVTPTPIQEKVIPAILQTDHDLIAQAQTGTGKTAAFGLPLIHLTDYKNIHVQGLVLCPTRELCIQITNDIERYSKFTREFRVVPVYGGANITTQIKALREGVHLVVGTPGRVLDLIKRKVLKISGIRWLVLDEADEMLNMGFKEDLDSILSGTPAEKRTLLFSATMPRAIIEIADEYMRQPVEITVGRKNAGAENVKHEYFIVHARDRYDALKRIADIHPKIYGIVFCRTREETKDVASKLMSDGYNADALHGDLSQSQRDQVMERFRQKHLQLLVATDVAARGIDVDDLTHIINFNLPDDPEIYIHRSGRTGRAGKSGVSISIIHTRETQKLFQAEKISGKKFERKMVPQGKEICEKQLFNLIDKVENVIVDDTRIEQFLPAIYKKLEWLSREDLIKHFVSVEFNRFLDYYQDADDLNVQVRDQEARKKTTPRIFSRFFINIGSKNGLNPARLLAMVNDNVRVRNIDVGRIDIMKKFSFFEIDGRYQDELMRGFRNSNYDGIPIVVQPSRPEQYASAASEEASGPRKKSRFR